MIDLLAGIKKPLEARAPSGVPTMADLEAINRMARREFTPEEVFVYPEVMANACMSSYAMWIGPKSLEQFASDATRGVPKHIQHERPNRAMGMTYAGHWDPATKEARAAVFIPKGRNVDGYSSNDEIEDIRTGMRRYVSVGPGGAFVSYTCDLCGKDIFDFEDEDPCWHIPGVKYGDRWASACLEGLHLIETSNVDKGAIPGAEIGCAATGSGPVLMPPASAQQMVYTAEMAEEVVEPPALIAGALSQKAVAAFRAQKVGAVDYRAFMDRRKLSDETRTYSTPPASSGREVRTPMRDRLVAALAAAGLIAMSQKIAQIDDDPQKLAAALAEQFSASVNEAVANHELVKALAEASITTPAQLADLRSFAELGHEYEREIRTNAEKLANAAFGQDKAKAHIETCKSAPLSTVRMLSDSFQSIVDQGFGYSTDDNGNEVPPERQTAPRQLSTYAADATAPQQAETANRLAEKTRARVGKSQDKGG